MERTAEKLIERRLDRMRLGQSVCEIHNLLSDPEIRVAMVPLTEAEYDQCMEAAVKINVEETILGQQYRDRHLTNETLLRALREPDNLEQQMFEDADELTDALEVADINYLIDHYFEMVDKSSPAIEGLTEQDIDDLKKACLQIDWKGLYGKQWYALRRFLLSLGPEQLRVKLPGSFSTKESTGMNDFNESTPENAEKS
jgi:hypothetical protein